MTRRGLVALLAVLVLAGCPPREEPVDPQPRIVTGVTSDATQGALVERLDTARAAFERGDSDALGTCAALGQDAITLGDEEAAAAVAELLIQRGHTTRAVEYLGEARQRFPVEQGHKALIFPEARALEAQGRITEAAQTFESALRIAPTNPFEYAGAADLWVAADEFDRASGVVEAGIGFFPGDPILLQMKAEVALRRGDAATAITQLDQLAVAFPDEVGVHVLRLEALVVTGRDTDARVAALDFERTFSFLSHGTVILGLAEARLGNADAAEAAWTRAEGVIAECTLCAGDEAALLIWAREQAKAERVIPQDR